MDKHYSLFTIEHIKNLCEYSNFKIVKIQYLEAPAYSKKSFIRLVIDHMLRLFNLTIGFAYPRILLIAHK